jgi:predicted glycosyltransferase
MFYCQYIFGIGHLVRSVEILRELLKNHEVYLINGGQIVKEFEFPLSLNVINIPAISVNDNSWELQSVDPSLSLEQIKNIRAKKLISIYNQLKPDILIVEHFPFGRETFYFELIPLLKQVKSKGSSTKVISSVRDIIIINPDNNREDEICFLLNNYFDMVLIHSDPQLFKLEESFDSINKVKCPIHYTGYVIKNKLKRGIKSFELSLRENIILVSVGSGRSGFNLLECVINAAFLLEQSLKHKFLIFTGPHITDENFALLQNKSEKLKNVSLNRYETDLSSYMHVADISISMGGYNTTMEVIYTGVKSIIFPFDMEQYKRAEKLEKLGLIEIVKPSNLQADYIADKIIKLIDREIPKINLDFCGAEKTASLIQ